MLAPNAPLRAALPALARAQAEPALAATEKPITVMAAPAPSAPRASPEQAAEPIHRRAARYAWALLLARIYKVFPLLCPKCGGEMRLIAFITAAPEHSPYPRAPGRAELAAAKLDQLVGQFQVSS